MQANNNHWLLRRVATLRDEIAVFLDLKKNGPILTWLIGGGLITWGLGQFFAVKGEQQKYLDKFIDSMSKLMIEQKFYIKQEKADAPKMLNTTVSAQGPRAIKGPNKLLQAIQVPESAVARAYVLNTLDALSSKWPLIDDRWKKQSLLRFLYEFQMLGFCNTKINPTICYEPQINLEKADLTNLDFRSVGKFLTGLTLNDANLANSSFREASLAGSAFRNSNLQGVDLSGADLRFANLDGALLQSANLRGALLGSASLKGAQLCGADLRDTNLTNADLTEAVLNGKTNLSGAFFLVQYGQYDNPLKREKESLHQLLTRQGVKYAGKDRYFSATLNARKSLGIVNCRQWDDS